MRKKSSTTIKKARDWFQEHKPSLAQLLQTGDYTPPILQGEYLKFGETIAILRATRKQAKLSLTEVARRSGIDKAALSRLENGVAENPTLTTLHRYATAVGKEIEFRVVDRPSKRYKSKPIS